MIVVVVVVMAVVVLGRWPGPGPARCGRDGPGLGVGGVGGVVDVAERDACVAGDPGAVLVFGAERRRPAVEPAELPLDRAERRLDLGGLPLQLVAADLVAADAQGGRLAEEDLLHRRRSSRASQSTVTITPGRFFFIWIGVTKASSAPAAISCVVA